jgi:hypothetical protein
MRKKQANVRQPFQFAWEVPEAGYRCERGFAVDSQGQVGPKSEVMLVELTPVGVSRMVRRHQTWNENTGLFLEFAQVDVTPEGIIAFANRYGALGGKLRQMVILGNRKTTEKKSAYPGEAVSAWIKEIVSLRRFLPLWDAKRKPEIIFKTKPHGIFAESIEPPFISETVVYLDTEPDNYERLRDKPAEIARHYLKAKVNAKLVEHYSPPRLLDEKVYGGLPLFIVPTSLIAALWLQFAFAIDGGRQYRSCKNCKKWFEIGSSVRRTDAEACSDSCRAAFAYKHRNRKGRAR